MVISQVKKKTHLKTQKLERNFEIKISNVRRRSSTVFFTSFLLMTSPGYIRVYHLALTLCIQHQFFSEKYKKNSALYESVSLGFLPASRLQEGCPSYQ